MFLRGTEKNAEEQRRTQMNSELRRIEAHGSHEGAGSSKISDTEENVSYPDTDQDTDQTARCAPPTTVITSIGLTMREAERRGPHRTRTRTVLATAHCTLHLAGNRGDMWLPELWISPLEKMTLPTPIKF